MQQRARERLFRIAEWSLLFALVTITGVLSKLFTRGTFGVSTIWLANGLTVGYLLYAPRGRWPSLLLACALGQLASGLLVHDSRGAVLAAAGFNTLEVVIAALPLRIGITSASELSRPRPFLRFLLFAVLLAPVLSVLALTAYLATGPTIPKRVVEGWYAGHALGMATMAPVTLALCGNELGRLFRREHLAEVLLGLALILITTAAVFSQNTYPLLFLIFPPVLLAALRGGFPGTAFALILVVVLATTLTSFGRGPLMLMSPAGPDFGTYLLLQIFIAVLMFTSFPVAVAMSAWRRNQSTERRLRNRLRLLADHSSDVIVLTDLDGRRLYVSPSVHEVLGRQPEEFLRESFRELVGAAHFEALQQQIAQLARKDRGRATITFPGHHADGRKLWLEARVKRFRDADFMLLDTDPTPDVTLNRGPSGEEGIIITLRDITRRRHAEQALETANRRLAWLVWKDGLTGLGNRRQFDQVLAESWEQCRQAGAPLAMIMLDVDYFKHYNDHYGHQDGDHCLAAVARAISDCLRGGQDSAARYGGEEFGVILPRTAIADAARIAERIRQGIEQLALPHPASPLGLLTVSLGVVACVPGAEDRPEDLVNAADRAMYASKAGGRNRVTAQDGLGRGG